MPSRYCNGPQASAKRTRQFANAKGANSITDKEAPPSRWRSHNNCAHIGYCVTTARSSVASANSVGKPCDGPDGNEQAPTPPERLGAAKRLLGQEELTMRSVVVFVSTMVFVLVFVGAVVWFLQFVHVRVNPTDNDPMTIEDPREPS